MKLLIRQGRLVDPVGGIGGVMDILLEDGRVAVIGSNLRDQEAQIIDARGLVVCAGLVDMHVHLREPGLEYKETIATGCAAAAAGGFTSIAPMPNTRPATDCPEQVRYVLEKAAAACGVHVLPIGAVTMGEKGEELTDAEALKRAGVAALSDDGMPVQNANLMRDAMLAEETGGAVHICHISTAKAVAIVRRYKKKGVQITCETCPQYFTLTEDEILSKGSLARVNPPLRTRADVEAIIEGLKDGTIDAIATDHAPHSAEEKDRPLTEAPSGMVGLETALAVTLTALYHTGEMSLSDILRKMTINPACILRVPKGRLSIGAEADIVIFDPEEKWVVDPAKFASKGRNTPFAGREVQGRVKYTIASGTVIYQDGEENPHVL